MLLEQRAVASQPPTAPFKTHTIAFTAAVYPSYLQVRL